MNGLEWTAASLHQAFLSGHVSAIEICEEALDRIGRTNGSLNALLTVTAERAREQARALDEAPERAATGPLAAVPVAVKDNICTRAVRTTAGSRTLDHFVPPYDAAVVERLMAAGAVIVGKSNCDEFAMGSSNEHSAFGPVCNPWQVDRTPGGSSGGSAAAVASRMVPLALGSDTGGSVRQPAGFCGVVGLKPTYGRVSRYGLVAFASSLDQIGPLTRTVEDTARLLAVIAGRDARDSTCAAEPVPDWLGALTGDVRGLRIGIPSRWLDEGIDARVHRAFADALDVFRSRGAVIVDVDLPNARHAVPVYHLIATAEASSNLARYDGVRYGLRAPHAETLREMYEQSRETGFGPEVKRRIILGTFVLSAGYREEYYGQAQRVRTLIRRDYEAALSEVDAIATPTSPTTAFRLGERLADPIQMYLADVFTVGAPLAGLPAVSVPAGFDADRLPIGLQLVGRAFDEETILRIAEAYERETGWWREEPGVSAGSDH